MQAVPDHCCKANVAIKSVEIFFASGGSCLQFVKKKKKKGNISEAREAKLCLYRNPGRCAGPKLLLQLPSQMLSSRSQPPCPGSKRAPSALATALLSLPTCKDPQSTLLSLAGPTVYRHGIAFSLRAKLINSAVIKSREILTILIFHKILLWLTIMTFC